ncbi:MAG: Hsp70 family protein [Candidatus Magnetoovum sp. WYHC-5]|nr:Hsp70 family protein [Candidatus Magnetoovum sp. WYHC-5]
MENSKYIVGVDLGTTNCVVSYINSQTVDEYSIPASEIFKISQVVDAGVVEELEYLPSFLYLPLKDELPAKSIDLPFKQDVDYVTGVFAALRGAKVPGRVVSSAKSWLCHAGVDRTSAILPWKGAEGVKQLSPLAVSSLYLEHMKDAWNYAVAKGDEQLMLENQDVYLTVPASFDAIARELTVKAANLAGFKHITLLEEPQAAFYAWLNRLGEKWRKDVQVGDIILVCDIGGGTTDFSLIEVSDEGGNLVLKRIAVGDHILLGGDNMDLTMAYEVQKKFANDGVKLDSYQMLSLIHNCRQAKEKMLNDPSCQRHPVIIPGRGRKIVGKTLQQELERQEVERVILDGFFPVSELSEEPQKTRVAGFKELGLKYAADTAVTKYLSRFLRQNAEIPPKRSTPRNISS